MNRTQEAQMPVIRKLEKRNFFSLRDAAEYTSVPLGTMKKDVYTYARIHGTVLGRTLIFTREQLDDYADDRRTEKGPGRYAAEEMARYLDVSEEEVQAAIADGRLVPIHLGGRDLFLEEQVADFVARGRSEVEPDRLPYYSLREAAEWLVHFRGFDWADTAAHGYKNALLPHVYDYDNITVQLAGRVAVVTHDELARFAREHRSPGRPLGSD